MKVLIADKLSEVGVNWLKEQDAVELDIRPGLSPEELAEIIGEYDGVIIRSGVQITAEVLSSPGRLECIARAGVGVDNVDVPTATSKGVIVMNTPGGNTVSTAELTWALMLAMSRKIVGANVSLAGGAWDRKKFQGTQLAGKTLGVIGMGRIGKAVAKRALAMEMEVVAYDPYFAGTCPEGSFEMVRSLEELCRRSDYITVHVPKSADTTGMIGTVQISAMKDGVRLINAARGGVIDPPALLAGLESGKVAAAALDVWTSEPPESEAEKKLIAHPNVLAVPHLGASTGEAQEQVALEAAQQLVEALRGGEIRNALNAPGFEKALPPLLRPYAELASRIGTILTSITPGAIKKVEVVYRGAISELDVSPITTYLLVGLLSPHMDQPVNVINAPVLAEQRGVTVEQITSKKIREFANLLQVEVHTDQMSRTAVGTIFGNHFPRIIAIDGYRVEMKPDGHVLIIFNDDMPGVVGKFGTILGASGVNIADMTLSRKADPSKAVIAINLDNAPSDAVVEEIRSQKFVNAAYYLKLPELPADERGE
ncbi:MAG: phosphoglycerate dehydrogenase [Planctomycetota bacterium]|nr:phosphoglycerate dehydrogenase [Planctomycetota bacterium]